MKKILLILFILIGYFAQAQPGYTKINSSYNWKYGMFDGFNLPGVSTPALKTAQQPRAGAMVYDSTGGNRGIHVYTGSAWVKLIDTTWTGFAASTTAEFLGSRLNQKTWSSTSGYTNNGASFTIVSNKLTAASGGNVNLSQSLDLSGATMTEYWKMTLKFRVDTKNGTSYGPGIGIRSVHPQAGNDIHTMIKFDMTSGAGSGKITILGGATYSQPAVVTAVSSAISFSVNDYIIITIERNVGGIFATAKNITTASAEVTASYDHSFTDGLYMHNTGRFALYQQSAGFTVDSLSYGSTAVKNCDLLIIGDSKTAGYFASNYQSGYAGLLKNAFPNVVVSAGPADMIFSVSQRIQEILDLRPKRVLMAIGSNSIRFTESGYTTRYDSIVTALTAAGVDVYHLEPMYESAGLNQVPLLNHIHATYPAAKIIPVYYGLQANAAAYLNADGIHPNDAGHRFIYESTISSFKIPGAKAIVIPDAAVVPGGSTTQVQFNDVSAFGGDAGMTYDKTNDDFYISGSIISPVIRGGVGTGSILALRSTGGAGATDAITGSVGNNGSTEVFRATNGGSFLVGTTSAADPITGNSKFKVVDGTAILSFRDHVSGQPYLGVSNGTMTGFIGHLNATNGFSVGPTSNHGFTIVQANAVKMHIDNASHIAFGGSITPSAQVQFPAGSASATYAATKWVEGTKLTAPEDGAFEKDDAFYATKTNAVRYGVGGTLNSQFTDVGNVGSGEDDLMSYTIPAGTLSQDGDFLEFTMSFQMGATANLKTVRVKFDASSFDVYQASTASLNFTIKGTITRKSATSQVISIYGVGANSAYGDLVIGSSTLSGAIVIKATGEATANNDIQERQMTVKFFPAN